ncbi:uncharacterized protein [Notamacropus eugenii]|uniref:uncharacterized protein isoform X1 n=1 Tax=Notamacropus eugenii TaxID=9315 RepID=UPI003B682DA4
MRALHSLLPQRKAEGPRRGGLSVLSSRGGSASTLLPLPPSSITRSSPWASSFQSAPGRNLPSQRSQITPGCPGAIHPHRRSLKRGCPGGGPPPRGCLPRRPPQRRSLTWLTTGAPPASWAWPAAAAAPSSRRATPGESPRRGGGGGGGGPCGAPRSPWLKGSGHRGHRRGCCAGPAEVRAHAPPTSPGPSWMRALRAERLAKLGGPRPPPRPGPSRPDPARLGPGAGRARGVPPAAPRADPIPGAVARALSWRPSQPLLEEFLYRPGIQNIRIGRALEKMWPHSPAHHSTDEEGVTTPGVPTVP